MTHKRDKNAVREHLRALKKHFLYALLLSFLILPVVALATPPFEETFNSYDIGILAGQGDWLFKPYLDPNGWFVGSVGAFEGQAIFCPDNLCGGSREGITPSAQGNWSLKFYLTGDSCESAFPYFSINLGDRESNADNISWLYVVDMGGGCKAYSQTNGSSVELGNAIFNEWVSTEIEWNMTGSAATSEYRVRYDGVWSAWLSTHEHIFSVEKIDTLLLRADTRSVDTHSILVDYIVEIPLTFCNSDECNLCFSENSCFFAGCVWNSVEEICEDKPFGVCGGGSYLRFCETQGECEGFGGYWVADYCWEIEPPSPTNWEDYYLEHSRFETPTTLTTSLVNLVAPITETAGGWLVSLNGIFVEAEATQKGELFGEAIPLARGYLTTINEFFGGFPISEAFIFFMIISLAVGVFRIVRSIILLIKPF